MKVMQWLTVVLSMVMIGVWPVPSRAEFVDNGNGTVTDTATGLIWQQDGLRDLHGIYVKMTWKEALAYCEALGLGNKTDWRLPTIKELVSLVDTSRYNPAIDTTCFPNAALSDYVSSTTHAPVTSGAKYVNFAYGYAMWDYKSRYNHVRAVRGGLSSIGEAVDNTTLTWATGGNATWDRQTTIFFYGGAAAQSGAITHNETSWVQTTVTGPGTLSFYWKVSSEFSYDNLRFSIDAVGQRQISGYVDWQQKSYAISSGTHTLKWAYTKNWSVSVGSDAGWLDRVVYTLSTCPDCPANGVITNATYPAGQTCSCSNATSITLGSNVTVESGAIVTFTAPKVNVQPGFHGANGATIHIKQ